MIRAIQRLRNFGVFEDLRKTVTLQDFAAKNIIYGWNYSGKTTLSRLFSAIGSGLSYPECPGATFEVLTADGLTITEKTLSPPQLRIEVFNSDFVASNLGWSGEDFESILLLGDDSIDAQREIDRHSRILLKCRRHWASARSAITDIEDKIGEAKTAAAKNIKTTLQLVETFTAAHLATEVSRLGEHLQDAILTDEAFSTDLRTALTSEREKQEPVQPIVVPSLALSRCVQEASLLLTYVPAVSTAIEYLRTNLSVSRWVESGLALHVSEQTCHFCGGALTEERLNHLRGHFSQDLARHRRQLEELLARIQASRLSLDWLVTATFASPFRAEAENKNRQIYALCNAYNNDLDWLGSAVQQKIDNPFEEVSGPLLFPEMAPALANAFASARELITRNNSVSDNFRQEKLAAIRRLKAHFAAKFALDSDQAKNRKNIERLLKHQHFLKTLGERLDAKVKTLQAKIDRAQKGRERLNERIVSLLGVDVIQIDVVHVGGVDRFALRRHGQPARNLSDGERTAIAFAFFLTKLEQHKSLDDVIVYIDDPISSLDSNHVFQIYSIIESTFFRKVAQGNGQSKWATTCRQLFLSTHNFEFFEMLKKLPIKNPSNSRYFLVQRTGPRVSTLVDLPRSLRHYTSEYHYLFSVIHAFVESPTKDDVGRLLALPNALRRFVELYTYMRLPWANSTVESRIEELVGSEKAVRITKLLHHFSHLETVERLATHTNLLADIDAVVREVMDLIQVDGPHFDALMRAVSIPAEEEAA
jgi:wobble nucleotide-excising tRNase